MDQRSRRTIYTQPVALECGSVLELPSGKFACVMRKVSGANAWKLVQVDVAKSRLVDGSEMELSGGYLRAAKLSYSSHVWASRCLAARSDEGKRARAAQGLEVVYG